jgi:hypothetical protein
MGGDEQRTSSLKEPDTILKSQTLVSTLGAAASIVNRGFASWSEKMHARYIGASVSVKTAQERGKQSLCDFRPSPVHFLARNWETSAPKSK